MKRTKRPLRLVAGLPLCVVLLIAGVPRPVRADGIVVPPSDHERQVEMPAQKAIVVWDEERGHEDLILSVELLGGPEAAWVVPVPSLPEVRAASPKWFEHLRDLTKPIIEEEINVVYTNVMNREVGIEEVGEEPVEVLSREQVGVYDVSILSADEPEALLDWLNGNGYTFPEEGGPILDAYVEEGGWYFVAARVLPGERASLEGDVQPLWFSFDAEQPVYPMRLTALMKDYAHVLIYVLANHRMEIPGPSFQTEFAGELTLRPRLSDQDDLLALLTSQPYYTTKLRCWRFWTPSAEEDLYFERSASDEPYHMVITRRRTKYVYRPETEPIPTKVASEHATTEAPTEHSTGQPPWASGWVMLGGGLAVLGLLAGLGLAWRRSRRKSDNEQDA